MFILTTSIQHNSEILASIIQKEKKKNIQIRKENVNLFLFADNMIMCRKNFIESMEKLQELIS